MNQLNSSYIGQRNDLLRHIDGVDLKILDIGCASGVNGKFLKESKKASYVLGVEFDETMGVIASESLDKVIIGNIEDEKTVNEIPDDFFNYILIGDVLEHLLDPWKTLSELTSKLKSDGTIIFSVPNSGHIDVAIHLLYKKTWPRNERGIFDKTHLRLFAKNDVLQLVSSSKLRLVNLERNFRYRDALNSKFPFYGRLLRSLFPDLYTLQYIAVTKKQQN